MISAFLFSKVSYYITYYTLCVPSTLIRRLACTCIQPINLPLFCVCVCVTHKCTCIHLHTHIHLTCRQTQAFNPPFVTRTNIHTHTLYMHTHIHTHPHIDKVFGEGRSDNGLAIPFNDRTGGGGGGGGG